MKRKAVLTVSAFYLAVLGVGFMFAPREIVSMPFQRIAPPH